MQIQKLAVICNACFWLTLGFQFWRNARHLHQLLLNTIVILGILAWSSILIWLVSSISSKRKEFPPTQSPGSQLNNRPSSRMFAVFNLFSFIVQLVLLAIKYL